MLFAPKIRKKDGLSPLPISTTRSWTGAVERVRPKMMTVAAIMAGLLLVQWSRGVGSEPMQRIAVPMIGGMGSSTLLTVIVIPAIYALIKEKGLPRIRR